MGLRRFTRPLFSAYARWLGGRRSWRRVSFRLPAAPVSVQRHLHRNRDRVAAALANDCAIGVATTFASNPNQVCEMVPQQLRKAEFDEFESHNERRQA
jgi:hypothetical protein